MDKGTRVICVSPINGLVKWQEYTVIDSVIAIGEEYVRLDGIENLVRVSRFKVVKNETA